MRTAKAQLEDKETTKQRNALTLGFLSHAFPHRRHTRPLIYLETMIIKPYFTLILETLYRTPPRIPPTPEYSEFQAILQRYIDNRTLTSVHQIILDCMEIRSDCPRYITFN